MHVHKTTLERHSFLGAITWSEIGKQKRQAKMVYYPLVYYLGSEMMRSLKGQLKSCFFTKFDKIKQNSILKLFSNQNLIGN